MRSWPFALSPISSVSMGRRERGDQLGSIRGPLLPCSGTFWNPGRRRRARYPDVRGRDDPRGIVQGAGGDHDPLLRRERLVPEARAAARAAHIVGFAPAVAALAVARDIAALVKKFRAVDVDGQEIGRARELLAVAAVAGDRRNRRGVITIADGAAQAAAAMWRRRDRRRFHRLPSTGRTFPGRSESQTMLMTCQRPPSKISVR